MLRKGIYKHVASGKLYNVLGVGRTVENLQQVVIYSQLYESVLKVDKNDGQLAPEAEILPIGSLWTREYEDFVSVKSNKAKFEFVE